jgi:ATP-binding cassette, subfamily B, bacterial
MLNKLRRALSQLVYIKPTLDLVWASAPRATVGWGILLVIQGLLPGATVYLTKLLVDTLVQAIRLGGTEASIQLVAGPCFLMGGTLLLSEFAKTGLSILRTIQSEYVADYIHSLVHRKSIEADLAFHEMPEFHDKLHQARNNSSSRPITLLESTGSLIQNLITLVTIAAVLIPYGLWLPIVLIISALPAFYFLAKFNKQYHRWWERTTPLRRQAEYHDFLITQSYTAAELRLFGLGDNFRKRYEGFRKQLRNENISLIQEQTIAQLGGSLMALVVAGLALGWMLWQALQGKFTLGDLALFYQAFNRGQGLAKGILTQLSQIYGNSLYLGNLFEYLNMASTLVDPPQPKPIPIAPQESIELRNVSFRYPGSDRWIFKDFNLTIPAGKIVAIVGENGAGKSTLIKLLCRFYDPETGSVNLDNADIRDFTQVEWRAMLTVMFQFPVTYQKTVSENIALGDVDREISPDEIRSAIAEAGATEIIDRLPQKENTRLGKWFAEGTDLSGGEWQRIALARAFIRQAPILILDEPTSFMDSWSEHDWLDRFRGMANGRTAIVITHRFTLAMRADMIHVLQAGQVIESGNHNTLLEQNGTYARSWRDQTNWKLS